MLFWKTVKQFLLSRYLNSGYSIKYVCTVKIIAGKLKNSPIPAKIPCTTDVSARSDVSRRSSPQNPVNLRPTNEDDVGHGRVRGSADGVARRARTTLNMGRTCSRCVALVKFDWTWLTDSMRAFAASAMCSISAL